MGGDSSLKFWPHVGNISNEISLSDTSLSSSFSTPRVGATAYDSKMRNLTTTTTHKKQTKRIQVMCCLPGEEEGEAAEGKHVGKV